MNTIRDQNLWSTIVILSISILAATSFVSAAPIVVDHTSVEEFDDGLIPDYWINQVKSRGMVFHLTGQSHGQQLIGDEDDASPDCIGGLEELEALDSKYSVQVKCDLDDLTESNVLRIVKGQFISSSWDGGEYECRNDDEHYWATPSGRQYTENSIQEAADQGDTIAFSAWLWSWHVIKGYASSEDGSSGSFDDARRDDYFDYIDDFNSNSVGTRVGYITAITDINNQPDPDYVGTKGWRVTGYNADIRAEGIAQDGVVFDQADIENWNYDNTEQRTDSWSGHDLQLRHEDYDDPPDGCGHGSEDLGIKKAKALWWLAARLAGWPGVSGSVCPDGSCNGDENCGTCPQDCGCGPGYICEDNVCVPQPSTSWVIRYQENFDTDYTATDGQTFGQSNWLTYQLINGGAITVANGYAQLNTPDFWNAALIRSTNTLPNEYKIRTTIGYINYDLSNYEQADYDNPDFYNQDENGMYFLTITDSLCSGSQCAELWWHFHRKMVIDVDNHLYHGNPVTHPVYMVYMNDALYSGDGGNYLTSWDGAQWEYDTWNVAHTYSSNTWYYAELEKKNGQIVLRLYDENLNIIQETDSVPLSIVYDMENPGYLYLGEPHTDDYEGDVRIDEITLWLPVSSDLDGDGIPDSLDNCWYVPNPDQLDSNGDCPSAPYTTNPICGNACDSGCCTGLTGNIDGDPADLVDLGDLTVLIDYLFITFTPPPACIEEANVDGDMEGLVDIGDLTAIIDHLFISFAPPAPCP